MSYPKTYRSYRRTGPTYPWSIVPSTEKLPETLAEHDVVIRIRAVALNYRDFAMLKEGRYPVPVDPNGIPASDCAAEVVAIGNAVTKFAIGDHVSPTINHAHLLDTPEERDLEDIAAGGNGPGVLAEYAVFEEKVLVKLPAHLSWEEASTITCAGITAWVALGALRDPTKGTTALFQGTGGVSMFALLIALAAGIKPIITSSSNEKLDRVKKISPEIEGINYKTHPDVAAEALRLTDGKGVDYLINNTGGNSVPSDLKTLRTKRGTLSLVGFLEGFEAKWDSNVFLTLIVKAVKVQGILSGSRKDFEDLNRFLDEKLVSLEPLIDRVFAFEDSVAAFEYLETGQHVGKVVIKI
ncbi:hypothetical protein B0J11DRAFT_326223 [Dendryphion nanum]|uniref:Enoyl reductase (ER) domain-containing protein n=1 Tax=Dendryphion nanum TaxID=256645 RepID=A0A9P9IKL9_9PLEO|nr:hypothetical protein B0J11DRAFT_326223 [Dendryphion nanum]